MNVVAGRIMRQAGYATKESGASVGAIIYSAFYFFPWAIRALFLLKSLVPPGLIKYFLRISK
jgi:hypothetical protein